MINLYGVRLFLSKIYREIRPIRGRNKIKNQAKSYKLSFNISGDGNEVFLSRNSVVRNVSIYIRGDNNRLIIEENCIINDSVFWIENHDGIISIGKGTTIEGAHFGLAENKRKIVVGEGCMFSSGIYLTTTDSHSILDQEGRRINHAMDVIIGDYVWLARYVLVLKGAKIGKGSIVGANSVVSKELEESTLYVGVPARKTREAVSWVRKKI